MKPATSHYHVNVSCQGERQTENHWHIIYEIYLLCYKEDAA